MAPSPRDQLMQIQAQRAALATLLARARQTARDSAVTRRCAQDQRELALQAVDQSRTLRSPAWRDAAQSASDVAGAVSASTTCDR